MDDRRAHFLSTVGDMCLAAGLASLKVEIRTGDGACRSGVPVPQLRGEHDEEIDHTGFASELLVDGDRLRLEDVDEISLRRPDVVSPSG